MRTGHNERSCWASVFKPVQRNGNMKRLKMSQSVEIVKRHNDKSDIKMAIYYPQGSGTFRQQLLIMH